MSKNKRLICILHDQIEEEAMYLANAPEGKLTPETVRRRARKITDLARKAKDRGQAMENRLYEYHNAIMKLGFTRDK
jgi:hypothetical protein